MEKVPQKIILAFIPENLRVADFIGFNKGRKKRSNIFCRTLKNLKVLNATDYPQAFPFIAY